MGSIKFGFALSILASLAAAQPTQPPAPAAPVPPRARILSVSGGDTYIGVMLQEIDSDRAKALKLPEEAGVEITRVQPDSPAEKAGLKVGDAIMHYNGQRVEGMEQFQRLVRETPSGRDVKLDIFRNGAAQTVAVKVAERKPGMTFFPTPAVAPRAFDFRMPDIPRSVMSWQSSMLGIEAESLDGQLAQYFGVKEGVLVRSVASGSAAEKAGLKAGDVIVRVDDAKVSTPADVSNRVRSLRGKPIPMVVIRDRKEVPLTLTLAESGRLDGFDFEGFQNGWQRDGLEWRQDLAPFVGAFISGPAVISWPRF